MGKPRITGLKDAKRRRVFSELIQPGEGERRR